MEMNRFLLLLKKTTSPQSYTPLHFLLTGTEKKGCDVVSFRFFPPEAFQKVLSWCRLPRKAFKALIRWPPLSSFAFSQVPGPNWRLWN